MTPIEAQLRHKMDQLTTLANNMARDAGMLTRPELEANYVEAVESIKELLGTLSAVWPTSQGDFDDSPEVVLARQIIAKSEPFIIEIAEREKGGAQ
jgi:hypothetical protein